jgi:hypothetical protein
MTFAVNERISAVLDRIEKAALRSGRSASDVTLMAVTKTYDRGTVLAAYDAGIRIFGENRVGEALEKYVDMPKDLELHLIGHLQTNKAKHAVRLFPWVDSVDSCHTAEALEKRLLGEEKIINILLEINTSGEDTKNGYLSFDKAMGEAEAVMGLPHLRLRGLMTLGPLTDDIGRTRRAFALLRECFVKMRERFSGLPIDTLSMGMSSDFEIAVEEGATVVRVGSALFGERIR